MGLLGRIRLARGATMATAAKRQLTISTALSKELTELALREGKSVQAFLQDLLAEHKRHRLTVEFKELQNYWSKKAKDLKTVRSLKGVLKGMSTENVREKPLLKESVIARSRKRRDAPVNPEDVLRRARALRRKPSDGLLTDRIIESLKRK